MPSFNQLSIQSLLDSIEETTKKVSPTLIRLIDDYVTSDEFSNEEDGLDYLEVCISGIFFTRYTSSTTFFNFSLH